MKNAKIVCICTGNGLKDPNALLKGINPDQIQTISVNAKTLEVLA